MTANYDKPFKTLDEQIQLLEDRNLRIPNKNFAREALLTVSYYDLINGYKEYMMTGNKFKPQVSIDYLFLFHLFDKNFQNIIFKNSTIIENILKTKIAYVLSKNIGVDITDYLNPKEYKFAYKALTFYNLKEQFDSVYLRPDKSGSLTIPKDAPFIPQPTRHYLQNHNHLPSWIILRNVSFGNAINLFRLIKTTNKNEIADLLLPNCSANNKDKINFLVAALSLIREFRNRVAHNLKFITYTSNKYRLPKKSTNAVTLDKNLTTYSQDLNDLYACLLSMFILLDSKALRAKFISDIFNCIYAEKTPTNPEFSIQAHIVKDYFALSKLPEDIITILLKHI